MDMPWKSLAPVDKGREYVALLSYLPLKRYRKLPAFTRFTFQILGQLARSSGAIGYAMRAKPMSREFWTLSVWESQGALMDFVKKVPHGEIMTNLSGHMGTTKFTNWRIPGSAIPPTWDDATRRMSQGS